MGSAWDAGMQKDGHRKQGMAGSQAKAQRKMATQTGPGAPVPLLLLISRSVVSGSWRPHAL